MSVKQFQSLHSPHSPHSPHSSHSPQSPHSSQSPHSPHSSHDPHSPHSSHDCHHSPFQVNECRRARVREQCARLQPRVVLTDKVGKINAIYKL